MRRPMVAALLMLMIAGAAPAVATPPGMNGQIAFGRFDPLLEDTLLFTVNPDGSHERQVLSVPSQCPRWSPDGAHIVSCGFPPDGAAGIIDPDDGSYRVVPMPDPDHLFTACPVMSPDGARLACEGFGEDRFENPTDPSLNGIYTIRASDGGGLERMTSNPGGNDQPGDYSPNGKRLVFGRFDEDEDPVGIYVIRIDGGDPRQITAPGTIVTSSGDWSPQGNAIVFSRRVSADMRQSLWLVHSDGTGLREIRIAGEPACGRPIAEPGSKSCFDPRWSPDGTKIVFDIFSDAEGENVYTAGADGTGLTQVTHGGEDEEPDWGTHPLSR